MRGVWGVFLRILTSLGMIFPPGGLLCSKKHHIQQMLIRFLPLDISLKVEPWKLNSHMKINHCVPLLSFCNLCSFLSRKQNRLQLEELSYLLLSKFRVWLLPVVEEEEEGRALKSACVHLPRPNSLEAQQHILSSVSPSPQAHTGAEQCCIKQCVMVIMSVNGLII